MRLIRPILTSFKKCSSIHRLLPKRPFHATNLLEHKIDYYSVLGISRGSDLKAVKVAYFRLAKKYHPDYNSSDNAEAMFELISEAYEVISDPSKRAKYDEHGEVGETFGNHDQVRFCIIRIAWKLQKFTLTFFWQKFRESNSFTKEIAKEMI